MSEKSYPKIRFRTRLVAKKELSKQNRKFVLPTIAVFRATRKDPFLSSASCSMLFFNGTPERGATIFHDGFVRPLCLYIRLPATTASLDDE